MASAPFSEAVPPIMVTAANDPVIDCPKKKRARRGRKTKTPPVQVNNSKPKKTMLLDEIGDALVDQLYTPLKPNNNGLESVSLVDHLRSDFTTTLSASSGASSRSSSSRTLTGVDSTPPTSVDDGDPLEIASTPPKTPVDQAHQSKESLHAKLPQGDVFSLEDHATMTAIQRLTADYGRVAHMGILDHSYHFFLNKARTAALSFKVQGGVAIVSGDPLCEPDAIAGLLDEFATYRRRRHLGIAFMGASESFVRDVARPQKWATLRFGTERVLNPQTNDVLLERGGKRIAVQNRQLLNPQKGGLSLGVYSPAIHGTDGDLQAELVAIYETWRAERNNSTAPQAFITVYDPFALPALMTFVYSRGPDGKINGFAALRRLGCGGYHVDPCIAAPGSAKGISDLLVVAAMALLHRAGLSYLGFGFEPVDVLYPNDMSGMPRSLTNIICDIYKHAFRYLPISGKRTYHDKFRPDPPQDSALYLVFPGGVPGPRRLLAVMHMANISLRKMMKAEWTDRRQRASNRKNQPAATETKPNENSQPKDQPVAADR